RRCRPVPHHREIPRAAKALGAHRGALRPCARARVHFGGDRVAHDDAQRSAGEHPAWNDRGVRGGDRRRAGPLPAPPSTRARPAACAGRIAANTQPILLDEANIARVADPTAGTGWSERLTDELCLAAWVLFQEIEAVGGAAAALKQGLTQRKVAVARAERERAV